MVAQASGLRWRLAFQRAVLPAQVVIALEKLRLRIKSRPTFGETARLAMQRRDVLPNRPVQAFQKRGQDLLERNQFRYAEVRGGTMEDMKEAAEELKQLGGMVQKVCPEYFRNGDAALDAEVAEFCIEPKPGAYRKVTPEELADFRKQYFWLDDDLCYYREQKERLRKEFLRLSRELDRKIARSLAGKARLREIILYEAIAIPISDVSEKAGVQTNADCPQSSGN